MEEFDGSVPAPTAFVRCRLLLNARYRANANRVTAWFYITAGEQSAENHCNITKRKRIVVAREQLDLASLCLFTGKSPSTINT